MRVWSLSSAQHAGLAEAVLAARGVPCHLQGAHLRTALAGLGPLVAIDVLVPAPHAGPAAAALAEVFAATA